jgi:hypothetical protein
MPVMLVCICQLGDETVLPTLYACFVETIILSTWHPAGQASKNSFRLPVCFSLTIFGDGITLTSIASSAIVIHARAGQGAPLTPILTYCFSVPFAYFSSSSLAAERGDIPRAVTSTP